MPLTDNFYIHNVKDALPAGELKDRLNDALMSEWFGYTHAFMNTVKHPQLIVHNASISFIDENRGAKVEGFRHKEKDYPACWVREVSRKPGAIHYLVEFCNEAYQKINIKKPKNRSQFYFTKKHGVLVTLKFQKNRK
ncbi:hypothetical protein KDX39_05200 [Pseudomonas sp. CDFA 610]|nr:hypothetical protein [Pseudomonas sp. CDFA 610]